MLVQNPAKANDNELVEVYATGTRTPLTLSHATALAFATAVAQAFGVGNDKTVPFDKERALRDVKGEEETKAKGKKVKKG